MILWTVVCWDRRTLSHYNARRMLYYQFDIGLASIWGCLFSGRLLVGFAGQLVPVQFSLNPVNTPPLSYWMFGAVSKQTIGVYSYMQIFTNK